MASYDFTIKAGASDQPLQIGIENSNNSAVDITSAFGTQIYMRSVTGGNMILNGKSASITNSTSGFIQYGWTAGDTSGFDGTEVVVEFHVSNADSTISKIPVDRYIRGFIQDSLK